MKLHNTKHIASFKQSTDIRKYISEYKYSVPVSKGYKQLFHRSAHLNDDVVCILEILIVKKRRKNVTSFLNTVYSLESTPCTKLSAVHFNPVVVRQISTNRGTVVSAIGQFVLTLGAWKTNVDSQNKHWVILHIHHIIFDK